MPGVLGRLNNPPAPFLRRLESLLLPPMPQPSCAAQACDGRKGLLEVLVEGDSLPSRTSPAVLVGRGCGRGWSDGGREGRSASRQELTGVMKKVCLSTQSLRTASPASINSASPSLRSALTAAVLVVAHLQPHLQLQQPQQPTRQSGSQNCPLFAVTAVSA